ncbi:hypothetical protein [Blastopirellula marina]|uniref:Uncharacterized protein n=1 Tax=Blastopirellula marina TaxID=124 RepID=A0A2S8FN65_9BACT|nr:hypothetical protein [Blastopirellula marina]PQO33645.1 hypothetical protein C5Y98_15505 [Blastopirellula marina]PTL43432.1 hypothetical protein C5Y97_15515 [Blastopirellula marina]
MRTNYLIGAFAIVAAVGIYAVAQDGESPRQDKGAKTSVAVKLDELLHQRRDTLASAYEHTLQQYNSGLCTYHEVLGAEAELANAELELASTIAARQVIHERRIKALRQQEAIMEKRVSSGTGGDLQLYQAKASRLQAEIEMLRDTED